MMKCLLTAVLLAILSANAAPSHAGGSTELVLRSELKFQPLNPVRGDSSPKAGVLWGDIRKDEPTGVLLKFRPGFSSPPHIHNITYRAVVISGEVHNDDPEAAKTWMGPGSFWTQPAGENHITSASSEKGAIAFLEILEGPYLVQPAKRAFDNGERPVNLNARNIVWLDADNVKWISPDGGRKKAGSAQVAFLWGKPVDGEKNGSFIKVPAGFAGTLSDNGAKLRAVVIEGVLSRRSKERSGTQTLEPGSYFGSRGGGRHDIRCEAEAGCLVYVSAEGRYSLQ